MSTILKFNDFSVLKILFHAAKFCESAVNGILLGPNNVDSNFLVTDYIPLFHTNLNLAPMLEVALYQVKRK